MSAQAILFAFKGLSFCVSYPPENHISRCPVQYMNKFHFCFVLYITLIFTHDSLWLSINKNSLNVPNPFQLLFLHNFSRFMRQLLSFFEPAFTLFFFVWSNMLRFVCCLNGIRLKFFHIENVCATRTGVTLNNGKNTFKH